MEPQTVSTPALPGQADDRRPGRRTDEGVRAPLTATLSLTVSLAIGVFLLAIAVVFAAVHPPYALARFIPLGIAEQNQTAKTWIYVLTILLWLPLSAIIVPRYLDRIARGPAASSLKPLGVVAPGGLALAILFTRLSGSLPWGDGLWVLAAALGVWLALTLALLRRMGSGATPRVLTRLTGHQTPLAIASALLGFGAVISATKGPSWHPVPLLIGGVAMIAVLAIAVRSPRPHVRLADVRLRLGAEALFAVLLLLAIVPAVVIDQRPGIPNLFFPPGIVQYHHDFLLGPANQLLRGGGALMVNVPISQYGVGPIYLLDAYFHLLPIGYGTYGLLDGILTFLFYLGGYGLLRAAGVRRLLAMGGMSVAVGILVLGLRYPIGELPQQGPLRFGLPLAIVLGLTCARRWPASARLARGAAFVALGLSAIWSLEAFAYAVVTLAAMLAVETLLLPAHDRRRWLGRQALASLGACVAAHVVLAGWTLAATGHLPNWGEYGTYIREFLIGGGNATNDVYGFERWPPGFAVASATLAAAVALPIVFARARSLVERRTPAFLALTGLTVFELVLLSYTDNRSSTYLLRYVTFPLLLVAVLWLSLVLSEGGLARSVRVWALGLAGALAAVLVAVAWPAIHSNLSRSVLAHAYPGGGLGASIDNLVDGPVIDPRAPEGVLLVHRYLPGRRVLVLTPLWPDLSTEILIRGARANLFFTGDPKADSYVPSVWTGKVTRQIAALPPGTRALIDSSALRFLASLRSQPNRDVIKDPIGLGDPQQEWVLQHLQRRFTFRPVYADGRGFVVAQLVPRRR